MSDPQVEAGRAAAHPDPRDEAYSFLAAAGYGQPVMLNNTSLVYLQFKNKQGESYSGSGPTWRSAFDAAIANGALNYPTDAEYVEAAKDANIL